jgi:flagellar basal-body rod protein FlgC
MKSKIIFVLTIFMTVSGCQSIKQTDGLALVVTPIELQIPSENGEDLLAAQQYERMSLYDYLKSKSFKVNIISNDPLIYEIPDQQELLEELAKMLKTIRVAVNVSSMNIMNSKVTRTSDGGPYRRKGVLINKDFEIVKIDDVPGEFKKFYDPKHPDADSEGYVFYPNVNEVEEQVQIMNMQQLENAIIKIMGKINRGIVALSTPGYYEISKSQKKWEPAPGGK